MVNYLALAFTLPAKLLAGLNAGMLWAGIVIVVFFEILRATFSALLLTMKLPKLFARFSIFALTATVRRRTLAS